MATLDVLECGEEAATYDILIKSEKEVILPEPLKRGISESWKNFADANADLARNDTTFFLDSMGDEEDMVVPGPFKYVQTLNKDPSFEKYSPWTFKNGLVPLSGISLVRTSDNYFVFGVKCNMNNKISGFSGYMGTQDVNNGRIDIERYVCRSTASELNINESSISKIRRIGQVFCNELVDVQGRLSNRAFNNVFVVDLSLSSSEVLEMFQANSQFSQLRLLQIQSSTICEFLRSNENNMSIHCVGALYCYFEHHYSTRVDVFTKVSQHVFRRVDRDAFSSAKAFLEEYYPSYWGLLGNSRIGEYSVAPQMWNALFEHLGLKATCKVFPTDDAETAETAIRRVKSDQCCLGLNVAMPWKEHAARKTSVIQFAARMTNTVNTVVLEGDLLGYNTDGFGLVTGIQQKTSVEGKSILLLGAGGAAQTLPHFLSIHRCKEILVYDIDASRAKALSEAFEAVEMKVLEYENLANALPTVDILINCTPCGMKDCAPYPLPLEDLHSLKETAWIVEAVYRPFRTPIQRFWLDQGGSIIEGVDMLVNQAMRSFEHALGIALGDEERRIMREAAARSLRKVLVTGCSGFLGTAVTRELRKDHQVVGIDLDSSGEDFCDWFYQGDIRDDKLIKHVFDQHEFTSIVHTAAIKDIKRCEEEPEICRQVNVDASKLLAELAERQESVFIFVSSDIVFDGTQQLNGIGSPTRPINNYGKFKVEVEEYLQDVKNAVICRTAMVFGAVPRNQLSGFRRISASKELIVQGYIVDHVVWRLSRGLSIALSVDEFCNPTSASLFARQIRRIIETGTQGTLHTCGGERISKYEFGKRIAKHFSLDPALIQATRSTDRLRPKDVSLETQMTERLLGMQFQDIEAMLKDESKNRSTQATD